METFVRILYDGSEFDVVLTCISDRALEELHNRYHIMRLRGKDKLLHV